MRDDEIPAEGHASRGQHPAVVVCRHAQLRRIETIGDAAENRQIALGAQHQRAGLARTMDGRPLCARVDAGVAVAGKIDVAVHVQVAVGVDRRVADDLHARTQVELVGVGAQAGELAIHQRAVGQRVVDEGDAVVVLAVQVGLVDGLVAAAVHRGLGAGGRIVVGMEGIDGDGFGAGDRNPAAGVDIDVVARGTAQARRIESHRAVAGARAGHAQVHAHAVGQHQSAAARVDLDDGAVGRLDRLPVAVLAQHAGAGIEHGAAGQGDAPVGGQADTAGLLAAGIDPARYRQAAVVDRDVDLAGLELVADDQVALLELEAAAAEDFALRQPFVQAGEIGDALRAHVDVARRERDPGATRIVVPGATAQDAASEVGRPFQRQDGQLAGAVVFSSQVYRRAGMLDDAALAARQRHVAAPAVFADVEEIDLAAGQVQLRTSRQRHVVLRRQLQLATGQQHRGVQHEMRAGVQRKLGAQGIGQGGVVCQRRGGACRGRDRDGATSLDPVHRTGLAGQQRRAEVQVAAAIGPCLGGVVPGSPGLVHRQRALVVGGDAFAGVEIHAGKAQRQALVRAHRIGLALGTVAELDDVRVDHQLAAAGASAAGDDVGRRRGRAVPDQGTGFDASDVARAAVAVDGRRAQHQPLQRRLAGGRVDGAQIHAAVEVDRITGGQDEVFQGRRAGAGITPQQTVEHALVQRQARGQDAGGSRPCQRLGTAHVDAAHGQHQVAGAIAHRLAQFEGLVGGGGDRTFRVQHGFAGAARAGGAGADVQIARAEHAPTVVGGGRGHVQPAIGHRQHPGLARHQHIAIGRVPGRLALPQRIDARALLDGQALVLVVDHQEDRCRFQHGALAQDEFTGRAVAQVDLPGILGRRSAVVLHRERGHRRTADADAGGAQAVERTGVDRNAIEALGGRLAIGKNLDAAAVQHHGAAAPTLGRGEVRRAGGDVEAATRRKTQLPRIALQ